MKLPSPTEEQHAGLVWRQAYNSYSTIVAGWLRLEFFYTKDDYEIRVAGQTLKGHRPDPASAAALAVAAAKRFIEKASAELQAGHKSS